MKKQKVNISCVLLNIENIKDEDTVKKIKKFAEINNKTVKKTQLLSYIKDRVKKE